MMTYTPKFEVAQPAFFMLENKVQCERIRTVEITHSCDSDFNTCPNPVTSYSFYVSAAKSRGDWFYLDQSFVFATKEELLKSL
jgi:hypothetical protein